MKQAIVFKSVLTPSYNHTDDLLYHICDHGGFNFSLHRNFCSFCTL